MRISQLFTGLVLITMGIAFYWIFGQFLKSTDPIFENELSSATQVTSAPAGSQLLLEAVLSDESPKLNGEFIFACRERASYDSNGRDWTQMQAYNQPLHAFVGDEPVLLTLSQDCPMGKSHEVADGSEFRLRGYKAYTKLTIYGSLGPIPTDGPRKISADLAYQGNLKQVRKEIGFFRKIFPLFFIGILIIVGAMMLFFSKKRR